MIDIGKQTSSHWMSVDELEPDTSDLLKENILTAKRLVFIIPFRNTSTEQNIQTNRLLQLNHFIGSRSDFSLLKLSRPSP